MAALALAGLMAVVLSSVSQSQKISTLQLPFSIRVGQILSWPAIGDTEDTDAVKKQQISDAINYIFKGSKMVVFHNQRS